VIEVRVERLVAVLIVAAHGAVVLAAAGVPAMLLVYTFVIDGELGLAAWRNACADLGRWRTLLGNTLAVVTIGSLVATTLGGALSVLLFKTDAYLRRGGIALVVVAMAVPLYVVNETLTGTAPAWLPSGSLVVLGTVHGVAHFPLATLVIGLALLSVERRLEEQALTEGARATAVLFRVTLRGAMGGFAAATLLVAWSIAGDYSAADRLLVRTFAEEVYTQSAEHASAREPTLVGLPQALLLAAALWFGRGLLLGRRGAFTQSSEVRRFALGPARIPLSLVAWVLAAAPAVWPIAWLASSFDRGKGIAHYAQAFAPELWTSLWTSTAAGAVCATLAVGLAWTAVRSRVGGIAVSAYVVAILATPAPVLGLGLIAVLNRPGWIGEIYEMPLVLVVAYTLRFLPIAVLILVPAVRAVPESCEMAARVDGASRVGVLTRIVWPLCTPAVLAAFLLVTALSLGELPCSFVVRPPGAETVSTRYFSLVHYGQDGDAGALCLLSLALIALPCLGLAWLVRRRVGG